MDIRFSVHFIQKMFPDRSVCFPFYQKCFKWSDS